MVGVARAEPRHVIGAVIAELARNKPEWVPPDRDIYWVVDNAHDRDAFRVRATYEDFVAETLIDGKALHVASYNKGAIVSLIAHVWDDLMRSLRDMSTGKAILWAIDAAETAEVNADSFEEDDEEQLMQMASLDAAQSYLRAASLSTTSSQRSSLIDRANRNFVRADRSDLTVRHGVIGNWTSSRSVGRWTRQDRNA